MGTAVALVDWALQQIGTKEDPPGSNHVPYWPAVGLPGFQGQPWCAAFYLAGLLATGTEPVTRSVFVPTIRANYRSAGKLHPVAEGEPGDQVLYRFGQGHTGVLVSIDAATKTITAVEGNTFADDHGPQHNGDGVYLKRRPWSQIWGVGRPVFDAAQQEDHQVHEEDDMAMIAIVPGAPADKSGRVQHWETDRDGNLKAWNGAPNLKPLSAFAKDHPPIKAIVAVPDGSGVILIGDDGRHEGPDGPDGEWAQSTYKITAGM